ncbi:MAG: VacJ family lipoprotein [Acinetobacter sp.]
MRQFSLLWSSIFILALNSSVWASSSADYQDNIAGSTSTTTSSDAIVKEQNSSFTKLKEITHVSKLKDITQKTINDLKVNANAAQPDEVKDPLQNLNRKVFVFNDYLDRNFLRPVAVQYRAKVPEDVRGSYRQFHNNLGEPWNVTNQVIQGKPKRALKSFGRFAINTLTTLGLADPANRLGLDAESESLGTTLGYYGVPSGPYLMLPFFGPSTLRDGFGSLIDSQAQLQKYILDDYEGIYWGDMVLSGVDLRSSLLDLESGLQGDRYAAIRDVYLQRKNFVIAQKKGIADQEVSFIDDTADNSGQ